MRMPLHHLPAQRPATAQWKVAECFHDLAVNLRSLAGGLHAHHALAVLGSPEVVVELNGCFGDSFHCLVLSAGSEQRMDKTKKEPHDGELIFPYR